MIGSYPNLLCAVDFSRRSRLALNYAAALTDHFKARLRVLTVAREEHVARYSTAIRESFERFVADGLRGDWLRPEPQLIVRCGEPGDVILEVADEMRTDLLVMSTHGDGYARGAYGSTAAHILAHASIPVLVAPSGLREPTAWEAEVLLASARIILAPVDFNSRALRDATIAAGIAEAFGLPLGLVHVVNDPESAAAARPALDAIADRLRAQISIETLVAHGDPALEIGRLAAIRRAGAIVMGLRGDGRAPGSPPGSIAFAVLCHAPSLVVALPPALHASAAAVPGDVARRESSYRPA